MKGTRGEGGTMVEGVLESYLIYAKYEVGQFKIRGMARPERLSSEARLHHLLTCH